jgi:hypothetical protein
MTQPTKPLLELVCIQTVRAGSSSDGDGDGPRRGASCPKEAIVIDVCVGATKAMLGGGAGGRWRTGGLGCWLGNLGQLLLHKVGFKNLEKAGFDCA